MTKPLAIDLFCGLGGWTEGLLAEGYAVIGFDIERHVYGEHRYPAQLVLQDVRTLHGSQFKNVDLIVASPPCQRYSYMAMPWTRAKAQAAAIRADKTGRMLDDLNELFDACFRIQREARASAGRPIPMVVENVKGAQPWVGRARWSYGSYFLWGDVPALMPPIRPRWRLDGTDSARKFNPDRADHPTKNNGGSWFSVPHDNVPHSRGEGLKIPGFRFDGSGRSFQSASVDRHVKVPSESGRRTDVGKGARFTSRDCGDEAIKHHASGAAWFDSGPALLPSSLPRRKFASAMIAKIPLTLSRHIGRTFHPLHEKAA